MSGRIVRLGLGEELEGEESGKIVEFESRVPRILISPSLFIAEFNFCYCLVSFLL